MVKYNQTKEDTDLSTSQSLCSDSDVFASETLRNIIDKMPKLTPEERRQTIRQNYSTKSNSRKWSQA
jgi:hypothetical protein